MKQRQRRNVFARLKKPKRKDYDKKRKLRELNLSKKL